jgi:hypothetical protein
MNTNPQKILENQQRSDPTRIVKQYTLEQIDAWQKSEIKEMRAVCRELGKELLVIDGHINCAVSFITELVKKPERVMPRLIAKRIIDAKREALEWADTVVLIDCDKTLSINDTTMLFCDKSGICEKVIKENFRGEYYSTYQFYRANKFYDEVLPDERYFAACDYSAETVELNEALIADIKAGKGSYTTFAVTAGILDIWERDTRDARFSEYYGRQE